MAREYPLNLYRNFGIMAHIDAGKTTTTERILSTPASPTRSAKSMTAPRRWTGWSRSRSAGSPSPRLRPPPSGSDRSDGKTPISKKHRFNIIDTPGHVDFTIEVERSLAVLDGAVCLLDANAGVEPQTETVWRQADRYKVPRIVFVNKMDKIGADFFKCVRMIKDRTGAIPAPIALPIGAEDKLEGIIDLVTMKEWVYLGEDLGASWEIRADPRQPEGRGR
jgi:elongation factor G